MYRSDFRATTTLLPFALLVLGACSTDSPTAPQAASMLSPGVESFVPVPHVAICPTTESYRTEGILGPKGGSLHVAGHRLMIPPGVLREPTRFALYAPAGPLVRLELTATGTEHYRFAAPVVVTISYDRCRRQHSLTSPATVWYFDDTGEQPIERMAGKDDRQRRAVTFRTSHFSTYVVAY